MTIDLIDAPPLPAWLERELPFTRKSARISGGRRLHFIDHGAGRPVMLMHGNPTWCFLWRKVIALLEGREVRVIAPDLLGFGLSDKPKRPGDHSLAMHVGAIAELAIGLDLREVTIVGQDWGGPVIAGAAMHMPERVRAAVFANTAVLAPARPFRSKFFHKTSHWPIASDLVFRGLGFPIPVLATVQGDKTSIGLRELGAYFWPLRRLRDRAGPLGLARMVPNAEDHPTTKIADEIGAYVASFKGPAALVWGKKDPILGRGLRRHREVLPHASVTETEAGHFLQEEVPGELVTAILGVTLD